ncbi:MAG: hypothetical protein IH859_03570, partial [Chloroflexi bacterium]|nr:hypothetical protein [Chloroflexota bacterium]
MDPNEQKDQMNKHEDSGQPEPQWPPRRDANPADTPTTPAEPAYPAPTPQEVSTGELARPQSAPTAQPPAAAPGQPESPAQSPAMAEAVAQEFAVPKPRVKMSRAEKKAMKAAKKAKKPDTGELKKGRFSRFTSRFNLGNLNVGGRLIFGFGTLVVLTLILSVATFFTAQAESESLEVLIAAKDEAFAIKDIQQEMTKALELQNDFLLDAPVEGFEVAFAESGTRVLTQLEHVREEIAETISKSARITEEELHDIEELSEMAARVDAYELEFADITATIELIGGEDSGLIADVIADLNAIDAQIDSAGITELELDLVHAQLEVFGYFLDKTEEDVEAVAAELAVFEAAVRINPELSSALRTSILEEITHVEETFAALVAEEIDAAGDRADLEAIADEVVELGDDILGEASAEEVEALAAFRQTEQTGLIVDISLAALATMISVALTVVITRSIANPITELTAVAEK